MSDSRIAKRLQEMLNEEKWTRATLSGYSVNHLKEIDALFREAAAEKAVDEVMTVCEEHLGHTKNSIIALYLSGIISLSRQQIDDSNMVALIDIFTENKKWNVVEYVCQRILEESGENRIALLKLAECYQNEERLDEMYEAWERLVRVDYEEADIVKALAEHFEKENQKDKAIDYYRKALHRFIARGMYTNVKEIWSKLVEFCPEDIDFFFLVQRKIAKQISEDKASSLLMDLYRYYKSKEEWTTATDILKAVIAYDEKNPSLRKEIIDCYRGKYSGHSQLEDYIRMSNLGQSYRGLLDAMADFEKHIAFDVGNYVFHRTWNIGRIAAIRGDEIVIDFARKRGHSMSLKMAIDSLVTLSRDHIWVLKAIWSREKLHDKVKGDVVWALRTVIKSFDNRADLKRIKAELVPSILTSGEWTSWSSKARETLKTDPLFGNAQDSIGTFIVRDRTLSFSEKIYAQFKAEKGFFERVRFLRDLLKEEETDSEFFLEMLGFFTGYLRSFSTVNEYIIASYLLVKEASVRNKHLGTALTMRFSELFDNIEDVVSVYEGIKDSELKASFLQHVKDFVPEWADVYVRLFPYSLSPGMMNVLLSTGHTVNLQRMVIDIVENYKDHRDAFIWVVRNMQKEGWIKELNLSYEKILITLIHILDISFKEIENHRDTTENRRINKQVQQILFKDDTLENFLDVSEHDTIERVYTLLDDVKDLDPAIKLKLRKHIMEKFPDFKITGEVEKAVVSRGLIVTSDKYSEKRKLLQQIMDVEVPANQKEITYALSLGDLRENAEYKAAKEKQDELNSKVAKLKNEIERAQIFDKSTLNISKVSFGTTVLLKNETEGTEETYTILGPWESDPSQNIISYLSPLGKKLMNHKTGDRLSFAIHDHKVDYLLESIKAAQL